MSWKQHRYRMTESVLICGDKVIAKESQVIELVKKIEVVKKI